MFRKVLIANRGEIARRVLRTCQRLGIATVAVYSDADAGAPHVREADEAVRIGPAPASESYLALDKVIDAASRSGAEAIHPGYGFLAENADFAEACEAKGIVFVGPPAETIRLMADKAAAKQQLQHAGVPVVPGAHGDDLDDAAILAAAAELGFPILLKAVAGGGGRGMRRVDRAADLPTALAAARREAFAAFGDARLLVETVVPRSRHVEIQVFGDRYGNVVHLHERDCSIQRRHQKVVEETPSPGLHGDLRGRMTEAAVRAARAVGYRGAGTVELLLSDLTGEFYFLEMNTRLQVEHPITELVTGLDLVEWQLRVAAGQPLPLSQEQIRPSGHAIEARIYAEDPARGFLPETGVVLVFDVPSGAGIRVDAGIEPGSLVGPHYDPLLAKLVVHGRDRQAAIAAMVALLRHTAVLGVVTNVDFLLEVVSHPAFVSGEATTTFVEENLIAWHPRPAGPDVLAAAVLGLLPPVAAGDPWSRLGPWRATGIGGWPLRLAEPAGGVHEVVVSGRRDDLELTIDRVPHRVAPRQPARPPRLSFVLDGRELEAVATVARTSDRATHQGDTAWVHVEGSTVRLAVLPATRHAETGLHGATGALTSPTPGSVAAVAVGPGDRVAAGTTLMVIEAMKMETPIRAPLAATVTAVHVTIGDTVDAGQPLVALEPDLEGP